MRREFKWDKKYLHWGLTAFFVIAASLVLFFILDDLKQIGAFFSKLWTILAPFIYGLVIAYLLNPLMKKMSRKMPKALAVLLCIIIVLVVITALVLLIIPELSDSIVKIVQNSPQYINDVSAWLERIIKDNDIEQYLNSFIGNIDESFVNFLQSNVVPKLGGMVTNLTSGVYYAVKIVYNLIVGIIVAAYVLSNTDKVTAGFRRFLYSIFTIPAAEKIRAGIRFVDRTFMNFFTGKLLDSAIIGLICYIFCAIVRMPYALLVSVIVGITNIIPFFGPFIGAIPSAIIILMDKPVMCLVFVIFIIILQQIDGNVIGPKILGNSIGINGFWIMFAIILGGGLFGFMGMLLGVPVFVCIYTGIKTLINKKLKRSSLPVDTESYMNLDYIDSDSNEIHKMNHQ